MSKDIHQVGPFRGGWIRVIRRNIVRDGRPFAPVRLEEFVILPGVRAAVEAMRRAGYLIIVATNQPDVGAGRQTRADVAAMHERMSGRSASTISKFVTIWRLITAPAASRNLETLACGAEAWDRPVAKLDDRGSVAGRGRAAGCRTVFVSYDYLVNRDLSALTWSLARSPKPRRLCSASSLNKKGINMTNLDLLKVKIFADGADLASMKVMYANPIIKGFTTNPTLMKSAGVTDYADFARKVLAAIPDRPVSFEVFDDSFEEMERQALEIASWGKNVNVKIPVTNTKSQFCGPLVGQLSKRGVQCNVTAVFTLDQVKKITAALHPDTPAIISVFAGRIADSGIDPVPLMTEAARIMKTRPKAELLWASPRELLNVIQADQVGCGIITVTSDIIKKLALIGKDQETYSLETVKMFYNDARAAGFTIKTPAAAR